MAIPLDCLSRPPPPPPEPDWGGLHYDILAQILKRMMLIQDFAVFGSVCKSWRIVALDNKKYLPPQIPWVMLQENPENQYHRQTFSLSNEDTLTKNLYIPELHDKMCIGLNYGWVFAVTLFGGEMNLVHPISRKQIALPSRTSVEGGYYDKEICPGFLFFCRVALCGNPSESSDFTVMAVHTSLIYVYYWRPGCKHWILVKGNPSIKNVTVYQNQFYAVAVDGRIFVLKNDNEGLIFPHLIGKIRFWALAKGTNISYIVGSTRGFLVVIRERYIESKGGEGFRGVAVEEVEWVKEDVPEEVFDEEIKWEDWRYGSDKFWVFELDLINGGYKWTKDLSDRAIFVGHNSSICFERVSELLGIKPNHIYFTDDLEECYSYLFKGGGKDMGVYSLEDDQITRFKMDYSLHRSGICPPFWFIQSL